MSTGKEHKEGQSVRSDSVWALACVGGKKDRMMVLLWMRKMMRLMPEEPTRRKEPQWALVYPS